MDRFNKTDITNKLTECIENHSEEGYWKILEKEIRVFRSTVTNNVCGFISTDYWTGWYAEELGEDLKNVMFDICENLFTNNSIKFKYTATLIEPEYSESKLQYKNKIKSELNTILSEFDVEISTHKCKFNKDLNIITGTFIGNWNIFKLIYSYKEELFQYNSYILDCKAEPVDTDILTFLTECFSFVVRF